MPDGSKLTRVGATSSSSFITSSPGTERFLEDGYHSQGFVDGCLRKDGWSKVPIQQMQHTFREPPTCKVSTPYKYAQKSSWLIKGARSNINDTWKMGHCICKAGAYNQARSVLTLLFGTANTIGLNTTQMRTSLPQDSQSTFSRLIDQCARAWMGIDAEVTTDGEMKMWFPILMG